MLDNRDSWLLQDDGPLSTTLVRDKAYGKDGFFFGIHSGSVAELAVLLIQILYYYVWITNLPFFSFLRDKFSFFTRWYGDPYPHHSIKIAVAMQVE